MAEGGRDPEDDNKLSGKSSLGAFLKNGTHENVNGDEFDDENRPDLGIPRRRENGQLANDEIDAPNNRREENPFSFKQFLKKDPSAFKNKNKHEGEKSRHLENGDNFVGTSRIIQYNSAPNFTSDLPDFVQGHFKLDASHIEPTSNNSEVLPDFTLDNIVKRQHNQRDRRTNSHKRSHVRDMRDVSFDLSYKSEDVCNDVGTEGSVTNSLPDFLSDGPMLSNVCERLKTTDLPPSKRTLSISEIESHQRDKINDEESVGNALRRENEKLNCEVEKYRVLWQRESSRIAELTNEIDNLKKKDKEEVLALEMMVQRVETNMQGTAERATHAEATIAKLKLEIKSLQMQVDTLSKENEYLKHCDNKRFGVTEKAVHVANQMRSAADSAQHQLMQLMSGVESLKLMAAILTDFDKGEELPPEKNT